MPNRFLRTLLFLSSYTPVFLILALTEYGVSCVLFLLSIALLIAGVLGVALFAAVASRRTRQRMTVVDIEARDADLAGYLVGYLLPFVGIGADNWRDVAAFVLFFVFLGIVYVNSRMIYVNPILALLGYHLYEVKATTNLNSSDPDSLTPQYLVSRRMWIRRGDAVTVRRVMADALIELPKDVRGDPQREE
ncbi:MAG TPA: hypothetical protein VGW80_04505 [Solirubrobacterales bacterium]|nr:hypothetical protein [Solirubrobacterales bacterium]